MWCIRLVWHLISFGDNTFIVELLYIEYFFDVSHVWHLCLVLGRGRTFVKPTGHVRFSVEFLRLF